MNHLNFSGMGLQEDHLLKIADLVQGLNSNVLSLHLSDNGIRLNEQLLMDLIDAFDIEDESLESKEYVAGLSKLT